MNEPTKSAFRNTYVGDVVFAAVDLENDGTHPDFTNESLLASEGTRGVIINIGHPEDMPWKELFLVRFEGNKGDLGPPVGCWPEELRFE